MATNGKTLGQVNPAAATQAQLCTPAAGKWQTVSTVFLANYGAVDALVSVYQVPSPGGAGVDGNIIYPPIPLPAGQTFKFTPGITLTVGDELRVLSTTANVTATAEGTETDIV